MVPSRWAPAGNLGCLALRQQPSMACADSDRRFTAIVMARSMVQSASRWIGFLFDGPCHTCLHAVDFSNNRHSAASAHLLR